MSNDHIRSSVITTAGMRPQEKMTRREKNLRKAVEKALEALPASRNVEKARDLLEDAMGVRSVQETATQDEDVETATLEEPS